MSIEKIYLVTDFNNNHLLKKDGTIDLFTLNRAFVFAGDFLDLKDAKNKTVLSVGVNSLQWVDGQYYAFVDICVTSDNPKKLEETRDVKIPFKFDYGDGDFYWSDLLGNVYKWIRENGK